MNMTNQDILELAQDSAYMRNYVHNMKFYSDMRSENFFRVCKHLNYYRRINAWIKVHNNKGKQQYQAKLNQLISRAPIIRFW